MSFQSDVNATSPPLAPRHRNESSSLQNSNHDDARSHTSASNASSRLGEIVSQAARILQGETPNAIEERKAGTPERSNDDDDLSNDIPQIVHSETSRSMIRSRSYSNDDTRGSIIDFLQDPMSEMTLSRRIALFCMKRYAWYNPRLKLENDDDNGDAAISGDERELSFDDDLRTMNQAYPFTHSRKENPSLERAWAYFEHVALSRYILPEASEPKPKKNILVRAVRRVFCKGSQLMQKAEPGEREWPTKLYPPIFTPHNQLGDFGLGIGLYFSTLRAITIMMFLAGVLNIPNFIYFSGNEYNVAVSQQSEVPTLRQGSAICVDQSWVPCPDCRNRTDVETRVEQAIRVQDNANVTFALHNNCNGATYEQAFVNYATLFFVIFGCVGLNMYLRRMERVYDEDEQTAQDYSILVENPPGDATDPREWHQYFFDAFDGAHVTACTIAVDNDLLVRSLVERRELLRKIEMMLEPGTSLDTLNLSNIAAKEERERRFFGRLMASISPKVPELFGRVVVLNARVMGLAQQSYPATKVFVSFETEEAQRRVLSALNFGSLDVKRNNHKVVKDPRHLFRGKLVLSVSEPDEPSTVRWQDLNEKFKERLKQQVLTMTATIMAIVTIAFIVWFINDKSVGFSAFAIAIFNSIFPLYGKFLTGLEAHSSEGSKQSSLYVKIALFRFVNTAVVITIITKFTDTLKNGGLVDQVYALFFAEIVTTNAIQLADPVGHLQRHFLAPRAATQDAMNLNFQGQVFELAERYTNMTKIVFLALWYCAIFPGALFLCSFALLINYFTDRFSLLRTWKRAPKYGTRISSLSRRYFLSIAVVAMALMSSYWWAGFSYDNLCPHEQPGENGNPYAGDWTLSWTEDKNETRTMNETVASDTPVYRACNQDFFRSTEPVFPFVSKSQIEGDEWMTVEQELITDIYGWTTVGVMSLVALSFVVAVLGAFRGVFRGTYEPCGDDQGINFSDVPSMSTYIPQIESSVFSYPLLACNIDGIDHDLLEWTDPDRPYVFYDLSRDAEVLLRGTDVSSKTVFSQVAHYPPPGKEKPLSQDELGS